PVAQSHSRLRAQIEGDTLRVDGVLGFDTDDMSKLVDVQLVAIDRERLAVAFSKLVFGEASALQLDLQAVRDLVARALRQLSLHLDDGIFVIADERLDVGCVE